MTEVWIYTLGASNHPNRVCCEVPWRVDEKLIFFGPCKKQMRELLRKQFLREGISHAHVTNSNLYIVGVNRSNKEKIRNVVWAGRLSEVMTFAEADRLLQGDRFHKLRKHKFSPLHVSPVEKDGELIGYEHVSDLHKKNEEWVLDLVSKSAKPKTLVKGKKLMLRQGTAWQAFDRDCCMLLENIFFASGQGIEFDEVALEILRQEQHEKSGIDSYAIFGLNAKGQVNGLRGTFLKITGNPGNRFIAWLKEQSRKAAKHQRYDSDGPTKTHCP